MDFERILPKVTAELLKHPFQINNILQFYNFLMVEEKN